MVDILFDLTTSRWQKAKVTEATELQSFMFELQLLR